MNTIVKIIILIPVVIVIALVVLNLVTERSIKTEIVINAEPETVWNALMKHEDYPNWNPFIKQISGSVNVGEHLDVIIQSEGNAPMNFTPEVLVNKEASEFRWVGRLITKGIADGEHYFILKENGTGQTIFIHGERFTGILSGLLMKLVGKDTEAGFQAMNEAMAQLVESDQTLN